jgi:hypothetical protein
MLSQAVAASRRFILIGLAAVLLPAAPALARTGDAAASPKAFLQAIYKAYVGSSEQAKGISLGNAGTIKRYFSPGLASLILDDDAAAKQRNAPPALGGDPFVGRQDWQISDVAIDVKELGAKATGTVSFTNAGKPEKVTVELLKVGDDWRIADIHWESGTLRDLYRQKAELTK